MNLDECINTSSLQAHGSQMGRTTPQRGNKIISASTPTTTSVSPSRRTDARPRFDPANWPPRVAVTGFKSTLNDRLLRRVEQYRKVSLHSTKRPFRFANHSPSSLFTGFIHRRTGESEEHRVDFRPSGFIIGGGSVKNASCDAWRRSKEIFISIFSFVLKSLYI